jgi:hypothetical protein
MHSLCNFDLSFIRERGESCSGLLLSYLLGYLESLQVLGYQESLQVLGYLESLQVLGYLIFALTNFS